LRPQLATWQKTIIETFIHTSLRNLLIIFSPGKSKQINLTKAISTATVTQLNKDQTLTKQNKSNFIVLCKQNRNMFFLFLYPIRLPISTISQLTNQIFHHQKLGKIYFMSYFTTPLTELKKASISLQLTALLHFAIKNYRDEIDQSKFWAFNFFVSKKAALIFFCFLTIPFLKRHNSITKNTTIL
jgi:hypothetical protein